MKGKEYRRASQNERGQREITEVEEDQERSHETNWTRGFTENR